MPVHNHVVCPYCALLCDDLTVEVDGDAVVGCTGCGTAAARFIGAARERPDPMLEGRPASLDDAVERAAALLAGARRPLVLVLGHQSSEAAGVAAALAERLGAALEGAEGMAATLRAMTTAGLASATLGEVRNRADVAVFWRADPMTTHPRLLERILGVPGVHRPGGRAERTLVAIGDPRTPTARAADLVLSPAPGGEIELLWTLRLLVKEEQAVQSPAAVAGLPGEQVARVARLLRGAGYGALFYAGGDGVAGLEVEGLLRLADELNAVSRWAAYVLPTSSNAWGTAGALALATGYGHAVAFEEGVPRHDGSSARALLEAGAADALLVIGAAPGGDLPWGLPGAGDGLPLVVVEGLDSPLGRRAAVRLPVAPPGVGAGGTMARLDRVALPLRPLVSSPWPADTVVLRLLLDRISRHVS